MAPDDLASADGPLRDLLRRAYPAGPAQDFDAQAGLQRLKARARLVVGTLIMVSTHGGYRARPSEGRSIVFGRGHEDVHVRFGLDDPMVSRVQGDVISLDGAWWLRNRGRLPIQTATRLVLPGGTFGPLPLGPTQLFVTGERGWQHSLQLHVAEPGEERREVEPDLPTRPPAVWRLDPRERLALVVIGQRYLGNEAAPQPVPRQRATEQLRELDPEGRWTARRVEHVLASVRSRLARSGVAGLARDEVGPSEPHLLTHNLITELIRSTTLTANDLESLE